MPAAAVVPGQDKGETAMIVRVGAAGARLEAPEDLKGFKVVV